MLGNVLALVDTPKSDPTATRWKSPAVGLPAPVTVRNPSAMMSIVSAPVRGIWFQLRRARRRSSKMRSQAELAGRVRRGVRPNRDAHLLNHGAGHRRIDHAGTRRAMAIARRRARENQLDRGPLGGGAGGQTERGEEGQKGGALVQSFVSDGDSHCAPRKRTFWSGSTTRPRLAPDARGSLTLWKSRVMPASGVTVDLARPLKGVSVMRQERQVVLVGAARTPWGSAAFKERSAPVIAPRLGAVAIKAALERARLSPPG